MELMHLSQRDAAKSLNVCLSTFKRQFSSLRPKLTWPTPSQRKLLQHRRRFQRIVETNQEDIFPAQQFQFGQDYSHIYEEILPDPKVLSDECARLKQTIRKLKAENDRLRREMGHVQERAGPRGQWEEDCDSTHSVELCCEKNNGFGDQDETLFAF